MGKSRLYLVISLVILLLVPTIATAQQIELTYWTHADRNREALEDELIEQFQAMHPNVRIHRDITGSTDHRSRVIPAFAAGRGPAIVSAPPDFIPVLISNGLVSPVLPEVMGFDSQQAIIDSYVVGSLDYVTVDGQLYGLPLEVTNWALFINDQHFYDAGLDPKTDYPKTWEDMFDLAEKMTVRRGSAIERRAFDFRYTSPEVWLEPMFDQFGIELYNEDASATLINQPATLEILQLFRDWGPHGRNFGGPAYSPAHYYYTDPDSAGMAISGLYQVQRILAADEELYENTTVVPLPRFANATHEVGSTSRIYMHSWLVNDSLSDAEKEMAWKFVSFLAQHAGEYLAATGLIQPTLELTDHPAYQGLPYSDLFLEEMAGGQYSRFVPNLSEVTEALGIMIEAAMVTDTDLQQILNEAETRINRALR